MAHVVVAGGGITGLVTAYELAKAPDRPRITLLEASTRLGGKILTTPFAGLPAVDAGPDAFLARVPWATDLCRELGLGGQLVSPATGRAYVWHDGALRNIPGGLVLGVPAGWRRLARSGLLSARGMARAATEPLLPTTRSTRDNLGLLIRRRFGDEVLERLVDPLIGGIYAGDADEMSLEATAPQIAEVAGRSRSLLLGLRHQLRENPPDPTRPVFYAPPDGMGQLVTELTRHLDELGGVDVRLDQALEPLARADDGRWRAGAVEADAVVLAVPAFAAAAAVRPVSPSAAALLGTIPYAGVVMVTLAVPERAVGRKLDGSGHLVPKPEQRHVTACSWASTKWAHWRVPGQVVLRASLGRFGDEHGLDLDDDGVVRAALADLRAHLGLTGEPTEVRVTRWPASFPQYLPGHAGRVDAVHGALRREAAGVFLAGAAYHGIGIPACIRQGRDVAATVLAQLRRR